MKKGTLFLVLVTCAIELSAQKSVIDSLQRIVALQLHDSTELNAHLALAFEYSRTDLNKAAAHAHRVIPISQALKLNSKLANGYQYLITFNQGSGQLDSASHYLNLLEKLSADNPSNSKIKICYNQSAGLYYKNQGQFSKALPYMIDNLTLLTTENEGRAGQLLNIGNTYQNLGEYKNAVTYHLQSLSLFEKVNSKRGQSFCLNSLGSDYLELKQYASAEKYYLHSEKLKEELGDKRGALTSWMSLGSLYQQTNKTDLSLFYFNKALVRAKELKLTLEEARLLFNTGSLMKQLKKNDEATKKFNEALPLARQSGDSVLASRIKTYLIAMKNDVHKEEKEEQTLIQNIKISLESGALDNTAEGHFSLAEWYESRNQFDKAYENFKLGQQLTDSIKGNEVIFQLKKLEEEYNNDKKEKEIELLKKDQELQALALSRERTNVLLIGFALFSVIVISILLVNRYRIMNQSRRELELEKVRNHIARDLHDDIGSTLSSINIMSQLAMNGDATQHLKKIALHSTQMMENMSDIVWSINPKNDTLEQVVLKMKEFAFEILEPKEITHSFQVDSNLSQLKLDVEKRKNLFLIFKEAINNAAKYSGGSNVSISLSVRQNKIQLSIIDNGKGFNEEAVKRGNGLINMKERATSMGGELSHRSNHGNGTEIHLDIPIT